MAAASLLESRGVREEDGQEEGRRRVVREQEEGRSRISGKQEEGRSRIAMEQSRRGEEQGCKIAGEGEE